MSRKAEVCGNVMVVSVDDNQEDLEALNKLMDAAQDCWAREIEDIARKFNVSDEVAGDIWYLRARSRWTPELEQRLIDADHAGSPIDSVKVCNGEWP